MKQISSRLRGRFSRFADAVYFFPIIAVVLLGMVWFTTFNLIRTEFVLARHSTLTLGRELLETYEAQALRSLREIDQSLKIVRYAHETGSAPTLAALETRDLLPPSVVFSVCMVDVQGKVVSSSDTGASCPVTPAFLQKLQSTDALVLSSPQEATSAPLSFGRRFGGNQPGAVIISVEPDYFVSGYDTQKYGHRGLNGLIGQDDVFQALRIGDSITSGRKADVNGASLSREYNGVLLTYWDGSKRYTFTRQLFGYPLVAVVALDEQEQMATARENAEKYLMRAAAGSLFLVLVFAALFRESWLLSLSRKREHEQAAQVEYMAYHDTLTQLPNRSLFNKLLHQELTLAKRNSRGFSLFFLDLDRFKAINDTLGHDIGDKLLIEVAERLTQCLRTSDVVARIGGDEFVALLPNHKGESCAEAVARKIINAISQPYPINGHELSITISIGISMYPRDGQDEHTLMKNADIAMYHAKTHGRNDFRFYTRQLEQEPQDS
ncbi:MAG TPA: GGDEF domain-containing protein [Methylophilaceae bacterium]|nr:GGDEF domain-containing protein [Methylophilaceae bacterium]